MKIVCPKCRANYEVALPPLGEQGIELKCAVCHHPFRIKKKAAPSLTKPQPPTQPRTGGESASPDSQKSPSAPPVVSAGEESSESRMEETSGDMLGLGDEPIDPDLPEEVIARAEDLEAIPDTKDWDQVADSAKALEEEELAEAAQYAEEFAKNGDSSTEPSGETGNDAMPENPEPVETIAKAPKDLVDPEIWVDAISGEAEPEAPPEEEASDAPFEDPELWAEAFADETAQPAAINAEPEEEAAEPEAGEEEVDDIDAWAEMFAEMAPEDDQWEKAAAESEMESAPPPDVQAEADRPGAQEPSPPEEVPPSRPDEVPPEPEPVPSPPPREMPSDQPEEVPPEPEGMTAGTAPEPSKSYEDLESELEALEAQRKKLKSQKAESKLKQLEEQRLMLELERQKLQGEAFEEQEKKEADAASLQEQETRPDPEPSVEPEVLTTVEELTASPGEPEEINMLDDDLDVIGLDEEFADQEKEVIGLDEEFARADAEATPEPVPPAPEDAFTDLFPETEGETEQMPETKTAVSEKEAVPPPEGETESGTPPKPLHPGFSALENLGGDFFSGDRVTGESKPASKESAMFDNLGKRGFDDLPSDPSPGLDYTSATSNEEPDDFTAAFFSQKGELDIASLGKQETDTPSPMKNVSDSSWAESLDASEEDDGLTREEMWEREFPNMDEDEEENSLAVTHDDPFSDVGDFRDEDEEDLDEYGDDARPVVIGREYDDDAAYEEEGFEGVDESAYEDYDDDEDYDLAFREKKPGLFSTHQRRKGGLVAASVVAGLLLLAGTGYFLMQTFTPEELTDSMVADGEIPEDMVPHDTQSTQTSPTINPEVQDLLTESGEEKEMDIDQLMGDTRIPETKTEPEIEPVVKDPETKPGNALDEAAQLLEPSADNELLKELEQSEILQESQQEIEQAIKQEEELAQFIDPNATIVAFNTILPVAYNTTDIRVLSFRLEIEMDTPDSAEVVRKALPVYENVMVSTVERFFKQRFYTDVVYAKEKLRDRLQEAFNKNIENGKIRKASFTDFAIQ